MHNFYVILHHWVTIPVVPPPGGVSADKTPGNLRDLKSTPYLWWKYCKKNITILSRKKQKKTKTQQNIAFLSFQCCVHSTSHPFINLYRTQNLYTDKEWFNMWLSIHFSSFTKSAEQGDLQRTADCLREKSFYDQIRYHTTIERPFPSTYSIGT